MAIEGPLRELGIHDVFQLLDLSRKTGVLRVTSELRHNVGTISFEGGAIIFAEIRSNPHPLGALLLRTGKIGEADLERARDMQERQGDRRRLGEILVSLGALTPRELERQFEALKIDITQRVSLEYQEAVRRGPREARRREAVPDANPPSPFVTSHSQRSAVPRSEK